jgi:hypothetical protein
MRSQRDDSTIAAPRDEAARAMGDIKWSSWVWHAICRHHTENCRNSSFQRKLHLGRVSLGANDIVSTFLSSKYAPQLATWSKESTPPNLMVSTGLDLDLFIVVDTCIYKRDDINLQTFDGFSYPAACVHRWSDCAIIRRNELTNVADVLVNTTCWECTTSRKIKLLTVELNPFLYCLFNGLLLVSSVCKPSVTAGITWARKEDS